MLNRIQLAPRQPPLEVGTLVRLDDVALVLRGESGGHINVLREINLSIRHSEVVGVLGPSGCGKTSLLQIIGGLIAPSSGACQWEPQLLSRRGQDMSVVFQKPTLLPWLSVEENVFLPLTLCGQPIDDPVRARANELLRLVRLHGFRGARPHELSGGMQMRVGLVRALITQPRLILMDEPFSALDEATRLDMCTEMLRLVSLAGASVVFVTHSIQEAAFVSNRVLQLSARPGRIIRQATIHYDAARDRDLLGTAQFAGMQALLRSHFPHA
jgi:NitT/TauT family transport system ATP-binding protein